MSVMSNLHLDIADEIELGELSYRNIAIKYGVTYQEVDMIAQDLREFDIATEIDIFGVDTDADFNEE